MKSKATSTCGVSPYNLNQLKEVISTPLSKVFSYCLKECTMIPEWLKSKIFFIHEDVDTNEPTNYRIIAIQNAFLKVF